MGNQKTSLPTVILPPVLWVGVGGLPYDGDKTLRLGRPRTRTLFSSAVRVATITRPTKRFI